MFTRWDSVFRSLSLKKTHHPMQIIPLNENINKRFHKKDKQLKMYQT